MKKLIFPIVCCFISITVSAQLVKQEAETQKKQSELDWFNCSFDKDSVYGAEVNKAYEYLKANKFVCVVRLMNNDTLKDLVFKSAKYHFKHDGEMPTQKERKQACAYLACTIINTAKDNLNLN